METVEIIANYGFPIAVTCFLLYQQFTTIKDNSNAINNLSLVLEKYYFENKKEK